MVYVGMDVHRKRTQVAFVDESGAELLNRNLPNDCDQLTQLLGTLPTGTPVVFEAAYGWGWLADLLDELELDAHLAHPSACKAIAAARLKDDRVDARTLAQLLRADLLPEAWLAPPAVRDVRALLRHRTSLVRMRTRLQNRIHALIADRGMHPPVNELWGPSGRRWLAALDLPSAPRAIVADCLRLIDAIQEPVARLDAEIKAMAKPDPRVEALTKLHGIGTFTALLLVAEIGDIERFRSARKLCAWAGLTPVVRNSDRKIRHGHISKQGPTCVRWAMIEAAHKAKTRPPFARAYVELVHRRGKKIATVAIGRKLLARCYHVLKEIPAA